MSDHVTEIVPDLDTMPDWAREAFEQGRFFSVALARDAAQEIAHKQTKRFAWVLGLGLLAWIIGSFVHLIGVPHP